MTICIYLCIDTVNFVDLSHIMKGDDKSSSDPLCMWPSGFSGESGPVRLDVYIGRVGGR